MAALSLDIAIIALLLITLGSGFRLRGALRTFRVDSHEFQPLIEALDKAADRAEAALGGLRDVTDRAQGKLGDETASAQRLLDELTFMTKRADQLAEQLDDGIGRARTLKVPKETSPVSPQMAVTESKAQAAGRRRRAPDLEQRLKTLR